MKIFSISSIFIYFILFNPIYAASDVKLSPHEIKLKKTVEAFATKVCENTDCKFNASEIGKTMKVNPAPFITYSASDGIGKQIAEYTSLNTMAIKDIETLKDVLEKFHTVQLEFSGIWAMSPADKPEEACEAIRLFSEKNLVRGATFYQPHSLNLEEAARSALLCKSDGITMRGIEANEFFGYILGVMREVIEGSQPPVTIEEHRERLKKYTTDNSPFWSVQ